MLKAFLQQQAAPQKSRIEQLREQTGEALRGQVVLLIMITVVILMSMVGMLISMVMILISMVGILMIVMVITVYDLDYEQLGLKGQARMMMAVMRFTKTPDTIHIVS